jgi:hypothetical protein
VSQAVAAAAAATSNAAAMQQQSGDLGDYQQSPADTQAAVVGGGGIGSLDSRLAKNRRPTAQDGPAAAGKGAADDWGAEPLGEDLLPM